MTGESPLRALCEERIVRIGDETVVVAWDPDGEVFFVRSASVPGLSASAAELDALLDELPLLVRQARLP